MNQFWKILIYGVLIFGLIVGSILVYLVEFWQNDIGVEEALHTWKFYQSLIMFVLLGIFGGYYLLNAKKFEDDEDETTLEKADE